MGKKAVFKLFYFVSIIITLIIAITTGLASYASNVSPESSKVMAVLALALPVLLIINLLFAVYWAIRLRFWVWIPIIAIACGWNFITSIYQFSDKGIEMPNDAKGLTIASYNVTNFGKDGGYSCNRIADFMNLEKVDIICIQEYGVYTTLTDDSIRAVFKDWPYFVVPKAEGHNLLQLAVFSKYPIGQSKLITYPDTQNNSMWCDIEVNGTTIRLFNNHFQTTNVRQSRKTYETKIQNTKLAYESQFAMNVGELILDNESRRAQQIDQISGLVKESPYPVLLCGDFNSMPSTYSYRTIGKSGLIDGFKTAGHGYAYSYRYYKKILRIDYIFHSPSINVTEYFSPDLDISSDHNPVVMRFNL